jgi:hypothetical protein
MNEAQGMHLNGILDRIKVPFLVTQGAHDRQIGFEYAHQTFDQLSNSPRRGRHVPVGCLQGGVD